MNFKIRIDEERLSRLEVLAEEFNTLASIVNKEIEELRTLMSKAIEAGESQELFQDKGGKE